MVCFFLALKDTAFKKKFMTSLAILSLLVVACTKKATQSEFPRGQSLVIQISEEPPTLDWNLATDTTSRIILLNIMEPLLIYNFESGSPELAPGLVSQWGSNNDFKTWTITLRENVVWTDDTPLSTQHLIDSFERLLNPQTGAMNAYHFHVIRGAKAYNEGRLKDFSKVGVQKLSDLELKFELEHSASYFPQLLSLVNVMPIRKDLIKKYGNNWTSPQHIQTLGAYRLKSWQHDQSLVLERNETYARTRAYIQFIIAQILPDEATAMNLFQTEKIDVLHSVPLIEVQNLRQSNDSYNEVQDYAIEYLSFNVKTPPFDNVLFRKALAHAIDRKQITDLFSAGFKPNSSFLPHGLLGHESDIGLSFDVKRAKKLLQEAGYSSPEDVPRISLHFYTDSSQIRMAENIQAQLKENLGLEVDLAHQEFKTYLRAINSPNPPGFFRIGWMAVFPDPHLFMSLWSKNSHFNTSGWSHKTYEELVHQAGQISNPEKRAALYHKALKILTEEEVPVIPLHSGARQYLISERVLNYPLNPINQLIFRHTQLTPF